MFVETESTNGRAASEPALGSDKQNSIFASSGGAERDLRGILAPKPLTPHGWPLRGTAEGDCLFGIRDVESGEGKGYPGLMKSKCGGTAMVLVAMLSLTGCSASDTTDRSYAGGLQSASEKVDSSVNRTKVLVQLIRVFKRSEIIDPSGQEKMYTSGWREKLLSAGYKDSDLVDGSEVVTISDSYASASAPGTTWHENAYMAHVPPNFKGHLVPRERQDNSIRLTNGFTHVGMWSRSNCKRHLPAQSSLSLQQFADLLTIGKTVDATSLCLQVFTYYRRWDHRRGSP